MQNRNRHIHLALVFVWALAHGIWIGSDWHARTLQFSSDEAAFTGGCCSRAGIPAATRGARLANSTPELSCAACQLSSLVPEATHSYSFTVTPATVKFDSPAALADLCPLRLVDTAHAGRGPPLA